MKSLSAGDLSIDVLHEDAASPVQLVWSGKSNHRRPSEVLDPFLQEALDVAASGGAPIELLLNRMEFMNSLTIASLVYLIRTAIDRGVGVTLVYASQVRWQRLSFEALKLFETSTMDHEPARGRFRLRAI